MSKFVCKVCGYIHEGDSAPERCPQCKVPADKFEKVEEKKMSWATEHVVGITEGVSEDIINDLRANFNGECSEVGMYLAMSRVAFREGYPDPPLLFCPSSFSLPRKKVTMVTDCLFSISVSLLLFCYIH